MSKSPVCDGENYILSLESTYRNMWQRYCKGDVPSSRHIEMQQPVVTEEPDVKNSEPTRITNSRESPPGPIKSNGYSPLTSSMPNVSTCEENGGPLNQTINSGKLSWTWIYLYSRNLLKIGWIQWCITFVGVMLLWCIFIVGCFCWNWWWVVTVSCNQGAPFHRITFFSGKYVGGSREIWFFYVQEIGYRGKQRGDDDISWYLAVLQFFNLNYRN